MPEKSSGRLERQMEFLVVIGVAVFTLWWLVSEPHDRVRRAAVWTFGPSVLYRIQTPLRWYRMRQIKRALANLPEWERKKILKAQYPNFSEERAFKFAIRPSHEVLEFVLSSLAHDLDVAFTRQENFRKEEVPDSRRDLAAALEFRQKRESIDRDVERCKNDFWKFHGVVRKYLFFGPEGIILEMSGVARESYKDHLVRAS